MSLLVQRVLIASLVPDPSNARTHPEANLDAIVSSLRRFGQAEPLVIQNGTRRVIAGHGRLMAMQKLGWTECDVVELEVSSLDATALAIALNRSAELAEWDDGVLARLLSELRAENAIDGVGFGNEDIDRLLAEVADANMGEVDEDVPPEPMDDPVSRRGDLWVLGNHRLLCGDSASRADVERLLGGARIQLVNTDPPYNVKVEPRSNNAIAAGLSSFTSTHHQSLDLARDPGKAKPTGKMRAKDRPLLNDFVSEADFERMLLAWFGNLAHAMDPGASFYLWGGYANCANYPPALKASGLYFSQAIIWVKEHPILTRKDYMGNHEWSFYGWREGAGHQFYGPSNAVDTWSIRKVNPASMVHLTEKPVELAARAIEYSSRRGENVLDLFGGSGSTLMACEHSGRKAFLMELDPAYCDVIVRRWEAKTQREAVLDGDGRTYAQLLETREPAEAAHAE